MRAMMAILLITCSLSACDSGDVHYVNATPVEPVEQGDLQ